jgi:hypothetical protein
MLLTEPRRSDGEVVTRPHVYRLMEAAGAFGCRHQFVRARAGRECGDQGGRVRSLSLLQARDERFAGLAAHCDSHPGRWLRVTEWML